MARSKGSRSKTPPVKRPRRATVIRPARMVDVEGMKDLIDRAVARGEMLPRTTAELYSGIRDFAVAANGDQVVGCVSLHVFTKDLAEIRSLVVDEACQGTGIGKKLVAHALKEARGLGSEKVFALTYVPGFFRKCGFRRLEDKSVLPHKVWTECIKCPHFPDCNEDAVIMEL